MFNPSGPELPRARRMGKSGRADRACSAGCLLPTSNPAARAARAVPRPTNFSKRGASRRQTPISRVSHYPNKGEPVCRPDPPSRRFPPAVLHVGIYEITRLCVTTMPLLDSSLFCCPSIFAQALRAAIVAAELPLRGKLRAEATTVFIDQRILEVMKKESNQHRRAERWTAQA